MKGFSLREGAAIAEISESVIRTAIERHYIHPRTFRAGKSTRYEFNPSELLFVKLLSEFPFPLPKQDKDSLRQILCKGGSAAGRWRLRGASLVLDKGELSVSIGYRLLRKELFKNAECYRRGRKRIVSNPQILGGEPVFEGTRIPLQHIAGLMHKADALAEIRQDYPALTDLDLAFASVYARMGPPPGRPRKSLELSRRRAA